MTNGRRTRCAFATAAALLLIGGFYGQAHSMTWVEGAPGLGVWMLAAIVISVIVY